MVSINSVFRSVAVSAMIFIYQTGASAVPSSIPVLVENIGFSKPVKSFGKIVSKDDAVELDPGAGAVYHVKNAFGLVNGMIRTEFSAPAMPASFLPLKSASAECICAFKIHAGRLAFEISDIGPRICLLDDKHKDIDSVIASVSMAIHPDGNPHTVDASVEDGIARLIMDSDTLIASPVPAYDFSIITLTAFGHPFTVNQVSVYQMEKPALTVVPEENSIYLAAVWHKKRFNSGQGLDNHHFITWEGGKAAQSALISVNAPDSAVYHALVKLGAVAGNNLTVDSWNKRRNPKSPEPDKLAEGQRLEISVIYGKNEFTAGSILRDNNKKPFNFRFAGNLKFIPVWQSGCVACLQSCPGSKVANSTYSMRDLEKGKASFTVQDKLPFKDEEEILVKIKVVP